MKKGILSGLTLIVVVAGLYFVARNHRMPAGTATGEHSRAPGFSLPTLTGQKLDLSSYRGKVVLLDFWATLVRSVPGGDPSFRRTAKQVWRPGPADHRSFYG